MKRYTPLIIFLLTLLGNRCFAQLPALIPYADGHKWGYADTNGNVVIKPRWDEASFFYNGRARVIKTMHDHDYTCIIDTKGKYIIPPWRHWDGKVYTSLKNASYNACSKKGKWGIIDENNKEILPCIYEKTDGSKNWVEWSGTFHYDSIRHACLMTAKKKGKFGIIDTNNKIVVPFIYDGTSNIYDRDDPPQYFVIVLNGKQGVVDTSGNMIVPANYYVVGFEKKRRASYIRLIYKDNRTAIADINGNIIIDTPAYSAESPQDSLIPVEMLTGDHRGKWGLVNYQKEIVIPCIYSSTWTSGDTIGVSIDSIDNISKHHQQYIQFFARNTHTPLSRWLTMEQALPERYVKPVLQPTATEPGERMKFHGKMVRHFELNGIVWRPTEQCKENGTNYFFAVQGIAGTDTFLAVIDSGGQFLFPPVKSNATIIDINWNDQLLTIQQNNKDSFQCVTDYSLKPILHFQRYGIEHAFYYKGTFYALLDHRIDGRDLFPDKPRRDNSWPPRHGPPNDYTYDSHPGMKLVNSNGLSPNGFDKLLVENFCDQYGYHTSAYPGRTFSDAVCQGYFLTHSGQRRGIVDINGRVMMPAVSFKYDFLEPCGLGIFCVKKHDPHYGPLGSYDPMEKILHDFTSDNEAKKPILYGEPYLVDSTGKVLLDSLTVSETSLVHTIPTDPKSPLLPLLHVELIEWSKDYSKGELYLDSKGHGYYGKRPTGFKLSD